MSIKFNKRALRNNSTHQGVRPEGNLACSILNQKLSISRRQVVGEISSVRGVVGCESTSAQLYVCNKLIMRSLLCAYYLKSFPATECTNFLGRRGWKVELSGAAMSSSAAVINCPNNCSMQMKCLRRRWKFVFEFPVPGGRVALSTGISAKCQLLRLRLESPDRPCRSTPQLHQIKIKSKSVQLNHRNQSAICILFENL